MRMSNIMGGPQPPSRGDRDRESVATIEAALDAGMTLLNTGDFYGMGHNETLVAEAIRRRRDQAFLSVKCGIQRTHAGTILGMDGRPSSIKNYAAYSLQRLGVDHIDLYQPARVDPSVPYEETIGAVADLIREGKARYLGVSEVNADQLRKAHATHPVAALEIEYSLASRFIERAVLPVARELGVGVVAYGVVTQGLLAGAMGKQVVDPALAASFPRVRGETLRKNLKTVQFLEDMAATKGRTPAQLAIAWMLSRGDDIVALLGMSRRSHLIENLSAFDISFSPEDLAALDKVFAPGAIIGSRS
jgi:aryl-alcohol dehydrogenase-like predicted oxidoreductase